MRAAAGSGSDERDLNAERLVDVDADLLRLGSVAVLRVDVSDGAPSQHVERQDHDADEPRRRHRIRRGERILFKTRNSLGVWQTDTFVEDFVFISKEAAQFLVDRGIKVVGIDYLSVGGYKHEGAETHRTLLEGGVWTIEGLNLSAVSPAYYHLVCLPLKLKQADGAPARAILTQVRASRSRIK